MFRFVWKDVDVSHKYDESPAASSDGEFKRHCHNFYEILYFICGSAVFADDDGRRPLKQYDAVIIKPGEFHRVEFTENCPYERYVLKLPATFLPQYIAQKLDERGAVFSRHPEVLDMLSRLDSICTLYSDNDLYYYAGCLATQLIIHLCATDRTATDIKKLAQSEISDVLQYISENIERSLTMTEIADALGYSPEYLSRKFYRHMGTPIMKYVRAKRILAAQKMLAMGTKPTRVAEALNFSDYSTFYRAYVSVTGKAPSLPQPVGNGPAHGRE